MISNDKCKSTRNVYFIHCFIYKTANRLNGILLQHICKQPLHDVNIIWWFSNLCTLLLLISNSMNFNWCCTINYSKVCKNDKISSDFISKYDKSISQQTKIIPKM